MNQSRSIALLKRFLPSTLVLSGILATLFIYWPGIHGPLMFEDVAEIANNAQLELQHLNLTELQRVAIAEQPSSPLIRISVALVNHWSSNDALGQKSFGLALHLMNGLLIYLLLRMLLNLLPEHGWQHRMLAALVTLAWMVHPISVPSVLQVSHRDVLFNALLLLISMLAYLRLRLQWAKGRKKLALAWLALFLATVFLGMLGGEFLLPMAILLFLLEWNFPLAGSRGTRPWPLTVGWLLLALTSIAFQLLSEGPQEHSLLERLLTDSRAILYHLGLILLPRSNELGLFQDDFAWSSGLLSPLTTLPAALLLPAQIIAGILLRKRLPLFSFGLLIFLLLHLSQIGRLPAVPAAEFRSYLPSMGVLLAFGSLFMTSRRLPLHADARIAILLVICFFYGAISHGRATSWQSLNRLTMTLLHNHPQSTRTNYEAASFYLSEFYNPLISQEDRERSRQLAMEHYQKVALLRPDDSSALLMVMLTRGLDEGSRKKNVLQQILEGSGSNLPSPSLEVDEALLNTLPKRLAQGSLSQGTVANLLQVSHCERLQQCLFEKGRVDELFDAVARNPGLRKQAALLAEIASRQLEAGNAKMARKRLEEAMAMEPENMQYKLNHAIVLYELELQKEARQEIEEVISRSDSKEVKEQARRLRNTLQFH